MLTISQKAPKKKQKQPQTAEQRILSESGVTYTHRNDELIKGAPRKSVASASTSKAPAAKVSCTLTLLFA